jgi:hypothetical protein
LKSPHVIFWSEFSIATKPLTCYLFSATNRILQEDLRDIAKTFSVI